MIVLGGSSRQSLAALRVALDSALKGVSAGDASAISSDLFKALVAIDSSTGLRRALTDSSRDAASKSDLVSDLFKKSLSGPALSLLATATSLRWSSPSGIADAIEQIAVEAEAAAANLNGSLDLVQSEIFTFSKLLIENPDLRTALSANAQTPASKQELLKSIFGTKFASSTNSLLSHSVEGRRARSIEKTVAAYSHAVTARRDRVNAHIKSSIALSDGQAKKLADSLTKKIGQPVHLNIEIDPNVLGGISIRFGDEVIDGTISNRLAGASRALVS
jgi:F-type H+-transporting ATPase subunit delta